MQISAFHLLVCHVMLTSKQVSVVNEYPDLVPSAYLARVRPAKQRLQ